MAKPITDALEAVTIDSESARDCGMSDADWRAHLAQVEVLRAALADKLEAERAEEEKRTLIGIVHNGVRVGSLCHARFTGADPQPGDREAVLYIDPFGHSMVLRPGDVLDLSLVFEPVKVTIS